MERQTKITTACSTLSYSPMQTSFGFARCSSPMRRLHYETKEHLDANPQWHIKLSPLVSSWEVQWPNGLCAGLQMKQSGFGPCLGHCVVFFTYTVPLFTQVYKWVLTNLLLGVTLRWTSIPSSGEQKYSQPLHAIETRISSDLMGHLARQQTLPYLTFGVKDYIHLI